MRRNFGLFGSYICLDFMKCAINSFLWPYVSVAMYNKMRQSCVVCEGISYREKKQINEFLCDFLLRNERQMLFGSINVVAGDVFFSPEVIAELGFPNAKFLYHQWHLLNTGLRGMFLMSYELLMSHLVSMIHALSESDFEQMLLSDNNLLDAQNSKNKQDKEDLKISALRHENYATRLLEIED